MAEILFFENVRRKVVNNWILFEIVIEKFLNVIVVIGISN